MGQSEKLEPPTFEEAVKHIVDPNYGLGLAWLWQLPQDHIFTPAAKVHDLRYDYLKPGENTVIIDKELEESFGKLCLTSETNGWLAIQKVLFIKLARVRGEIFEQGPLMCKQRGHHHFEPCTYGQDIIYDNRCLTCGLHRPSKYAGLEINKL